MADASQAHQSFQEGLGDALLNLVSLEINTVECGCITAERYPGGALALGQVLTAYALGLQQALQFGASPDADRAAFDALVAAARSTGPSSVVAQRVLANEVFLRDLLASPAAAWPHRARSTLRKLWEVGADRIVAQSVITMDGDMTLRVDPAFLRDPAKAPLLEAHKQQVAAAMGWWGALVKVLVDLVRGAVS